MKTYSTERRHWVNGHQVRGGWFHTFNMSIFSVGLMFSWGGRRGLAVKIYKLV